MTLSNYDDMTSVCSEMYRFKSSCVDSYTLYIQTLLLLLAFVSDLVTL
jgi:RNA 3'-terminal phosphate cyclase